MVFPSAEIVTEPLPPTTTLPPVWAPLSKQLISFTPAPPSLSTALRLTVTSVWFQPLTLGPGEAVAVVVGGVTSRTTMTT